jgi:hypothetical protein
MLKMNEILTNNYEKELMVITLPSLGKTTVILN